MTHNELVEITKNYNIKYENMSEENAIKNAEICMNWYDTTIKRDILFYICNLITTFNVFSEDEIILDEFAYAKIKPIVNTVVINKLYKSLSVDTGNIIFALVHEYDNKETERILYEYEVNVRNEELSRVLNVFNRLCFRPDNEKIKMTVDELISFFTEFECDEVYFGY